MHCVSRWKTSELLWVTYHLHIYMVWASLRISFSKLRCESLRKTVGLLQMQCVYGALRPSSRISKLRCVSLWETFELLRMQCVHCCRDSQQRVALCVFLEDG